MSIKKVTDITEEKLLSEGWIKSNEKPAMFLFEKLLPNRNSLNNDPDDTDIKLVMHQMYNCWRFAVLFPDGGLLNLVTNSMKDLNFYETHIDFYDCPY